jgi:hypothetical protein
LLEEFVVVGARQRTVTGAVPARRQGCGDATAALRVCYAVVAG